MQMMFFSPKNTKLTRSRKLLGNQNTSSTNSSDSGAAKMTRPVEHRRFRAVLAQVDFSSFMCMA